MPRLASLVPGSSVRQSVCPWGSVREINSPSGTKSLHELTNITSKNAVKIRSGPIKAVSDPLAAGVNLASELGIQVTETGRSACNFL